MRFKWAEKGKTVCPAQIVLVFDMFVYIYLFMLFYYVQYYVCARRTTPLNTFYTVSFF
jgi:hypothetical protein